MRVNVENLIKSYTEKKLFDGAAFSLQEGEKVGVIGINGTGKTTLLKMIMADKEPPESLLEEKMDRWMYLEELSARIAEQ